MYDYDDFNRISFAEWLIQLNACAAKSGYKCRSLTNITGQLCWLHAYESGLTPNTALTQAAADGIEFGEWYCFTTSPIGAERDQYKGTA